MKTVSRKSVEDEAFPPPGDKAVDKKSVDGERAHPGKKAPKESVKVIANVDVGFGNYLYIRGNGCGLSWDRGVEMRAIDGDHWLWERECNCKEKCFEFKVLVNDEHWSGGENFVAIGATNEVTPRF